MKEKNRRKKVVTSALVIGAIAGGAEKKAKLDAMTEEERKEWLENHKPKDGERPEHGKHRGKPADLTDEEWEQKKAELKEKLDAMTEEEKKAWRESHRHKKDSQADDSQAELPAEE